MLQIPILDDTAEVDTQSRWLAIDGIGEKFEEAENMMCAEVGIDPEVNKVNIRDGVDWLYREVIEVVFEHTEVSRMPRGTDSSKKN